MVFEFVKSVILGIVEGITEWLPISSTGHMILVNELIGNTNPETSFTATDLYLYVIQLGAILAVVTLYFHRLNPLPPKKSKAEKKDTWQMWFKVLAACIPAAVIGLLLNDFMEHFENQTLWKISMKSNTPGMRFGDVYFVYEDPEAADLECGTAPLFGSMGINGSPEGSAAGIVSGNAVTVTGMANNTGASRVWLNGLAQTDLSAASGLRFWVDTTQMGEDGLLQLRIRLRAGVGVDKVTDVYAGGKGGYATLSGGMPQYVCRADNSVAYWYDENGEAHALRVADTVATDANGDVFEALPAGYAGYVYIPFDSFWMSCGSFGNLNCNIPFADAMAKYPIDLITI